MIPVWKLVVVVAAGTLVVAGCGGGGSHRDGARTYYESLDLSSPTAAVETFTEAFADDDFVTVWLAFSHTGQFVLQHEMDLLQWKRIIGPEALDDLRDWLQNEYSLDMVESVDGWWLFDRLMLIADESDGFLIDLSGDVSIGSEAINDGTAIVSAEVSGIEGDVEFRLRESATGRWRIQQVVAPGGDNPEDLFPWVVPSTSN